MWISARTATTVLAVVSVLAVVGIAVPFLPPPHLTALPEERAAAKLGDAAAVLNAPERVRVQRMGPVAVFGEGVKGGARWGGQVGSGPAKEPAAETVKRLLVLLRDPRTIPDARAADAAPTLVVRLLRDDRRADVMIDPAHDRVALALDGAPIGTFATAALHKEFAALAQSLLP